MMSEDLDCAVVAKMKKINLTEKKNKLIKLLKNLRNSLKIAINRAYLKKMSIKWKNVYRSFNNNQQELRLRELFLREKKNKEKNKRQPMKLEERKKQSKKKNANKR